jgi:hypothetical protein
MPPVAYARSRDRLVYSKYGGCDIDLAVTPRRAAVGAAATLAEFGGQRAFASGLLHVLR